MITTDLDQRNEIEQAAIRILSQFEHTVRQLKSKLLKRGFAADDVDEVLKDLQQQNLVSDQRFAEEYATSRLNKGFGPVRIAQEMREKGVSEVLVDNTLDAFYEQWPEVMDKALHKKFAGSTVLNFAERARRARFLEYRGFPAYLIRQRLFSDD